MICKKCGEQNSDDSKFCSVCGNLLEPEAIFCKVCGEKLTSDCAFCPKCGKAVDQQAPTNEKKTNKIASAYLTSVISTIAVVIIRFSCQTDYVTRTLLSNTYYTGIMEDNIKLLFSAIPAISFLISALLANSSKAIKDKKIKALVICGILTVIMLLLIWVSIPREFF